MIPGDLLSACPHRQFHRLTGLLDSRAALSNFYLDACMPMQGGSLHHFMMVIGVTRPGTEPTTYRVRGGLKVCMNILINLKTLTLRGSYIVDSVISIDRWIMIDPLMH